MKQNLRRASWRGLVLRAAPQFRIVVLSVSLAVPAVPIVQALAADTSSGWVGVPAVADPLLQNLTIPADAPSKGMWSGVNAWPMNGLHSILLPNGKLLTFGSTPDGGSQNGRYMDVWDPTLGFGSNSHVMTYRPGNPDSFCGTATFLTSGQLMIGGGNGPNDNILYSTSDNTTALVTNKMASPRWYATMITLSDGRPLMLGGMVPYSEGMQSNPDQAVAQGLASMTPEVYESTGWRSLFGAYSRDAFGPDYLRTSYPRAWVISDGRVFGISAETMWYLDPAGNGSISVAGKFKTPFSTTTPPNNGATSSAVMFAPGKILQVGGNGGFNGDALPASALATVIDVTGGTPVLTEQPAMSAPRRYPNSIVLPDGKVLITGGTRYGNSNGTNAVYGAEIWNPATGSWTLGANAAIYRGYHSITSLLPNGTILSSGGGTPGPVTNLNAEVYYPPYLFRTVNGVAQLATRPVMRAVSGLAAANGAAMQIDMNDASTMSKLVLIGTSAGTHSFNSGQRLVPLSFTQQSYRLTTTIPASTVAPPGYYQLVAVDTNGVPSRGVIVAIGQGVSAPPVATTPYSPPDLSASISAPIISSGATANYSVSATVGVTYSWDFGDGSAATAYSSNPNITHVYTQPGVYVVTLVAIAADGSVSRRTFEQGVGATMTARAPSASSAVALEMRSGASSRLWVVNPDNDSVAVIDTSTNARIAEITAGASPRSVAVAPDGRVWVSNKKSATLTIVSPSTLAVAATVTLPRASQPHGLAFAPGGAAAYVVLEATGQLLKLNPSTGAQLAVTSVGARARHISVSGDASTILVSRFITPPLPGESTAVVDTSAAGAEVLVVNASSMSVTKTVVLRHSDKTDTEIQGSGIPNYLGAAVISPDGKSAWVPSKQDNIKRGALRNGLNLDFQNSVRAISSRIDMGSLLEDYAKRIDHDNSGFASAAVYHPSGVYLFVALETSRQVAVVDAFGGHELLKVDVGRAPQGLTVSADGQTLFVQNFMDRSVTVFDLQPLVTQGELRLPLRSTVASVGAEKLSATVLRGKQFFYDARDGRLARDSYVSCASCHNDADHDGRVWDFTGFGEGLRNTIALNGRGGVGHGFLHWSANFDEVHDFEGQIRNFAGGTGLMSDTDFNTGTRSQPLGDKKAGISADLDALAAYLGSLGSFSASPYRNANGSLTAAGQAGRTVFQNNRCAACHGGIAFTASSNATGLMNIGTIKSTSGKRLNGQLTGIDIPTLRDVWATPPYLHDGSAATLADAVKAHIGTALASADLLNLSEYLRQIGSEEVGATLPSGGVSCASENGTCAVPAGTMATVFYGASGKYFAKAGVTGSIACNNGTFGDPIAGTRKSCVYVATSTSVALPAGSVSCASENGSCTIPAASVATVYYGAAGRFFFRTGVSGNIACNNATFGDPVPGTGKSCNYVLTQSN